MRIRGEKSEREPETTSAKRLGRWALLAKDSGQAMVEMALVLPLLLIVLTGICSFGIIMEQYQVLTLSTSDGARAFALSRGQTSPSLASTDPCAYAASIANGAATTLNISNITYTVYYTPPGGSTSTYSNVTATDGCPGLSLGTTDINGTVQIVASYPVTPLVYGWARSSLNMQVSASEQIQ